MDEEKLDKLRKDFREVFIKNNPNSQEILVCCVSIILNIVLRIEDQKQADVLCNYATPIVNQFIDSIATLQPILDKVLEKNVDS